MEVYAQYGAIGGMLLACYTAILFLVKWLKKKDEDSLKEREKYLKSFEDIAEKADQINKETNSVIRENTNILHGLKALLENQNRNK